MVHIVNLSALLVIFLCSSLSAGESITSRGMDYFMASRDPEVEAAIIRIDKHHTDKVINWISNGRMNDAIADLKFTLDRLPNHPRALLLIGNVAKLTHNHPLAITYYEKAIRLFPQYALTHAQYGLYLSDIGKIETGIEKLKTAINLDPKLAPAYAWLAKAHSQSGRSDLALQAAEHARMLGYKGTIEMGTLHVDKPAR